MCTNGTRVPCKVPSLPNPTTRKGWPHHRGLRLLLFPNIRDLKIRGRRRQWKRLLKQEFPFFQYSSQLFHLIYFVKCRQTLLGFNPWELHPSLKRAEKFRRALFTSSVKREIRHFHLAVVQWRQRKVQKSVLHVQSCCFAFRNLLLLWRSRCRRRISKSLFWSGNAVRGHGTTVFSQNVVVEEKNHQILEIFHFAIGRGLSIR